MDNNDKQKQMIWAIVPAAGVGARMAAGKPKQYLSVANKTIIEHTLLALLQADDISGVQLCVSANDPYWPQLAFNHDRLLPVVDGGAERVDSVLAGLKSLSGRAKPNDWILVHDAARPCLSAKLLQHLIDTIGGHEVGGILAIPLADTIKYAMPQDQIFNEMTEKNMIEKTVDRQNLWAAQTPQMFRYSLLMNCLEEALATGLNITDESSAIEAAGYRPLIVPGSRNNIKVTYPEDVEWLEYFLSKD